MAVVTTDGVVMRRVQKYSTMGAAYIATEAASCITLDSVLKRSTTNHTNSAIRGVEKDNILFNKEHFKFDLTTCSINSVGSRKRLYALKIYDQTCKEPSI